MKKIDIAGRNEQTDDKYQHIRVVCVRSGDKEYMVKSLEREDGLIVMSGNTAIGVKGKKEGIVFRFPDVDYYDRIPRFDFAESTAIHEIHGHVFKAKGIDRPGSGFMDSKEDREKYVAEINKTIDTLMKSISRWTHVTVEITTDKMRMRIDPGKNRQCTIEMLVLGRNNKVERKKFEVDGGFEKKTYKELREIAEKHLVKLPGGKMSELLKVRGEGSDILSGVHYGRTAPSKDGHRYRRSLIHARQKKTKELEHTR